MLIENNAVTTHRTLLVADWAIDPHAVVAAAIRRDQIAPATFALVVPAWLHGLDWAGDPGASAPCACKQLEAIQALAAAAGLPVHAAGVGDPDPTTAITDALADSRADDVLLCVGARHVPRGPFDLARRVRRVTGLEVRRVAVPAAGGTDGTPRRHCAPLVTRAGRAA
jgi:hypothetical protein